jgi:LysM repeat protein
MARGLFELLQKIPSPREESLCQAFVMTSEFGAIQLLFQKTDAPQEISTLIDLASESTWGLINGFAKEQAQLLDLSIEKRRRFLLSCLAQRSKTAAKLLLQTDFAFVAKRLDDSGICDLLSLLTESSEEANNFCIALLTSVRADSVRIAAATKLYGLHGEMVPVPLDVPGAIGRFCPKLSSNQEIAQVISDPAPVVVAPPKAAPVQSAKAVCYHTVAEGETLWKIARQYKIKVEDLVQLNGIENGKLYPGMTLQVP